MLCKECTLGNGRKWGGKGEEIAKTGTEMGSKRGGNSQNRNGLSTKLRNLNGILRAGRAIEGLIAGK